MIVTDYWTHIPKVIPSYVFEPLLIILQDYCQNGTSSTRKSCVFNGIHDQTLEFNYGKLPIYPWKYAPSIFPEICRIVESLTKEEYDYVLVHIYPSGDSAIAWHRDSEALGSSVASVSLGATRKFRFRTIGNDLNTPNRRIQMREAPRTKGWDHEIKLEDGDLIIMHGPDLTTGRRSCQEVYQHCVPVEKTIKNSRINMTFRKY